MRDIICAAIRDRVLLELDYDGRHRVIVPYCHGMTKHGEVLRAVQVGGDSRSGALGFGKLWTVEKMLNVRRTEVAFLPNDPHYNPQDSAMTTIHCCVQR